RIQCVVVAAAVEDETEIAHYYPSAKRAVQAGRETDHVARAIDDRDVTGVALVIGKIASGNLDRAIKRRRIARELFSRAGTKSQRRRILVDHRAPLSRVFL